MLIDIVEEVLPAWQLFKDKTKRNPRKTKLPTKLQTCSVFHPSFLNFSDLSCITYIFRSPPVRAKVYRTAFQIHPRSESCESWRCDIEIRSAVWLWNFERHSLSFIDRFIDRFRLRCPRGSVGRTDCWWWFDSPLVRGLSGDRRKAKGAGQKKDRFRLSDIDPYEVSAFWNREGRSSFPNRSWHFFVGLLVTRARQEWILEEALVDVVDDGRLPTANVLGRWGNRSCSGRSSSCMAIKRLLCASLCRWKESYCILCVAFFLLSESMWIPIKLSMHCALHLVRRGSVEGWSWTPWTLSRRAELQIV